MKSTHKELKKLQTAIRNPQPKRAIKKVVEVIATPVKKIKKVIIERPAFIYEPAMPQLNHFGGKPKIKMGLKNRLYNKI